jgi:3'(2'), 5'-bisphosphate nucleotidase
MRKSSPIDLCAASRDAVAEFLAGVVLAAGPAIMAEYIVGCEARMKHDASPVTVADEKAEEIILDLLRSTAQPIDIIAEETAARSGVGKVGTRFLLVDPLDGTREFIAHNGEFTVNVALVCNGVPVAGAVYAPAVNRLWFGGDRAFACEVEVGAEAAPDAGRRLLHARAAPDDGLVALASRSHCDAATEAFLAKLHIRKRTSAGSSLKFCAIAEGDADVYPRFAPTMEWDTAAGDAVLRAAGGVVRTTSGPDLRYGKDEAGFRNSGFIAFGDPALATSAVGL